MKDVVSLLGTVIQHLERQAKPPAPKVATVHELYPELQRPALPAEEEPVVRRDPGPTHTVLVAGNL